MGKAMLVSCTPSSFACHSLPGFACPLSIIIPARRLLTRISMSAPAAVGMRAALVLLSCCARVTALRQIPSGIFPLMASPLAWVAYPPTRSAKVPVQTDSRLAMCRKGMQSGCQRATRPASLPVEIEIDGEGEGCRCLPDDIHLYLLELHLYYIS